MEVTERFFSKKKAVEDKLSAYGFVAEGGKLVYRTEIVGGMMKLEVSFSGGRVFAEVTDPDTGDEYALHAVEGAQGEFVGKVRADFEQVLSGIASACFEDEFFRYPQTGAVISYANQKYGDDPEYLWEDTPDCCVLRRKDNNKWYAVIMTVGGNKFGRGTQKDEVIDVRVAPEKLDEIEDGVRYFRGYHMNKKHWMTVVLDGSVAEDEIFSLLDDSYALAAKK